MSLNILDLSLVFRFVHPYTSTRIFDVAELSSHIAVFILTILRLHLRSLSSDSFSFRCLDALRTDLTLNETKGL